jgi:hypothetical protein
MQKPSSIFISIFLLIVACSQQAVATSVLPVSLQHMATTADLIFHGRVISNAVRLDETSGRVATFTSFAIIELIKGDAGSTHTIKQVGGHLPGSNMRQVIHGVPRFSVGAEYVVFLPKASSLGFASPIGLAQGKFLVHKQNGTAVISDRRAVATMASSSAQPDLARTASAIETGRPAGARLPDFLQTVRGMIGE